ncbi:MAG TPA: 6-pyruvoyl-tetrahydropterin synthase-related protein [Patescibacteria group bacterium]|nr:6-pyruvoyl-tetrahydropterin synthase-related protein [Patescibacteria group bacterium]
MRSIKNFLKHNFLFFTLSIFSVLPLIDLLHPGLPVTHDGRDHVARIANFYQNLAEGNLVPRWAGNLNWGYGHPVLMFLYPLPSYLGSLFHFLGLSFVDSTKLVFAFSFVASILTMYLWLRQFLSKKAAVVGGLLYGYAPYHFVDLYVRGAIGEMAAFIFPPLVCYFMYKLSQKNTYQYLLGGAFSLAGFILAHNAVSLMFLPMLGLYAIYLFWQSKNRRSLLLVFCSVLFFGFSLSAFFWAPAFLEGRYTLRDIVIEGVTQSRFVSFSDLVYGNWNYGQSGEFTVQVGMLQWLGVLFSVIVLLQYFKKREYERWLILGLLFVFIGSLVIMLPLSQLVWDNISILQKFQFPWRFLFVTMFSAAVLGAYGFSFFPKRLQTIGLIIFIIMLVFTTKDMWYAKTYVERPERFYTDVFHSTTDTGESAPIWSVRFMEKTPSAPIEIIGGEGKVTILNRTTTKHEYEVITDERMQLRENTLYFPGWEVFIDNKPVTIEFQDQNNRGVMTFFVEPGTHTITVLFTETKLRFGANVISIVSLFVLIFFGIFRKKVWQN